MGGIYGDTLLAWPEQQRTVTVFNMTARINGGWENVEGSERAIIGIFQNTCGKEIKDANGNLVRTGGLELWTAEKELDGLFINQEGTVYRVKASNDWSFEGGFIKYRLEKVVGNNGTESDQSAWNTGYNSFS